MTGTVNGTGYVGGIIGRIQGTSTDKRDGLTVEKFIAAGTQGSKDAASDDADQDLVKLIRSVDEGEVAIAEYNQNGKSKMAVLVYRIDPDGKGRDTYRADSTEAIVKALRQDDFDKAVKAKEDAQADSVKINSRAVKMCDPKSFFE